MVAAAAIAVTGGGDLGGGVRPRPLDAPAPGPSLAVGITEPNPHLVAAPDQPVGATAAEDAALFARRRDELAAIEPSVYRLVVDWSVVQPAPDAPPNLEAFNGGCMRGIPPCAAYAGVRDQLRAVASRGWDVLLVITGTPPWAAAQRHGCADGAGDAPPRADALPAYRRLVADLIAAAAREGANLRYLSPWNEPNHPYFLAPQRATCDEDAPSLAAAPYAELARAMRAELTAGRRLVLGETAGIVPRSPRATSVAELIAALPSDLVCSAPVWGQHAYAGGTDPVAAVTAALDAHACPRPHAIWITETGVGPAPEELSIARQTTDCRLLHDRLVAWYEHPRVTAAFQYTFREDDRFPTGLVGTDLRQTRPALAEWQAWGARPAPDAPPPRVAC